MFAKASKIFKLLLFLKTIVLVCATFSSSATTFLVPLQFSTIQLALNACNTDDTVLVDPGIYTDTITWPNKQGIKLLSTGDQNNTIIDAQQLGRAINIPFNSYQTNKNIVIRGFTVKNGIAKRFGGGLYVQYANILLENLIISNNHSDESGGGLCIAGDGNNPAIVTINKVIIENNDCITSGNYSEGAGMYISACELSISNSEVNNNSTYSALFNNNGAGCNLSSCNVQISNTKIQGNKIIASTAASTFGGGIFFNACDSITIINSLFCRNEIQTLANSPNGGAMFILGDVPYLNIENATISENKTTFPVWNSIAVTVTNVPHDWQISNTIIWSSNALSELGGNQSLYQVSNSDIKGYYLGTNNITTDPLFIDTIDFRLPYFSPCIGTGHLAIANDIEGNPRPQPFGTNPDMGCYEIDQDLLAIHSPENDLMFVCYPTIVTNQLLIMTPSTYNISFEIVFSDLYEHQKTIQIKEGFSNPINIPTSEISSGFYVLKICQNGNNLQQFKFIKR